MPEKNVIRKTYTTKSEVDDDERTVTAVISTSAVDREKEVLLPKGADYEQYLKNPVVLWAHDYRETPIGKALWIKSARKNITAKVRFAETEKADEIYQLFKGHYLNAFSVGFLPAENGSHPPTPDEVKKNPEWAEASRIYDKWELLEFSAVPVPANPEALATAVKSKELVISKETQDELGIEVETTYYADTSIADAVEKQKYKCECIKCGHKLTTEKHCNKIKCPKCGGEMRREERPGPGREIESDVVLKPYPNEHSCRLKPPNYPKYRRQECAQKHDGKCIDVIYGIKSPKKSEIQALRFDKKIWTAASAKSVCSARGGTFEAAKSEECEVKTIYPVTSTNKAPTKMEFNSELFIDRFIKRKRGIMYE